MIHNWDTCETPIKHWWNTILWHYLTYIWQYLNFRISDTISNNILWSMAIFDNFGNPARSDHFGKYLAMLHKIRQYLTILDNIGKYQTILVNIYQNLTMSNNCIACLGIWSRFCSSKTFWIIAKLSPSPSPSPAGGWDSLIPTAVGNLHPTPYTLHPTRSPE